MGLVISGLGLMLMLRYKGGPPFAMTTFSGYQIGAVLTLYGAIRLLRTYWIWKNPPRRDEEA